MKMNIHELFDKAMTGVLMQGKLSKSPGGRCYYRHPDDPAIRCAVGHLITDEEYNQNLEFLNCTMITDRVEALKGLPLNQIQILRELQRLHDEASDIEEFLVLAGKLKEKIQ